MGNTSPDLYYLVRTIEIHQESHQQKQNRIRKCGVKVWGPKCGVTKCGVRPCIATSVPSPIPKHHPMISFKTSIGWLSCSRGSALLAPQPDSRTTHLRTASQFECKAVVARSRGGKRRIVPERGIPAHLPSCQRTAGGGSTGLPFRGGTIPVD